MDSYKWYFSRNTLQGLRFYNTSDLNDTKGAVFSYNITGKSAWELKIDSKTLKPTTFNPHGISVWEQGNQITIFVVNHRPKSDTVEVFRYKDAIKEKILVHLRTVRSPLFYK